MKLNHFLRMDGLLLKVHLLLLVGILGCSKPAPQPVLDPTTVKMELQELQTAHRVAIDSKDIEGILQFYSPDMITISPGQPIQYGREYIRPNMTEIYKKYDFQEDFVISDIRIMGDRVAAAYKWSSQMTPLTGGKTITETGRGMCILKRYETDSWQFEWNTYFYDSIPPVVE